MKYTRNQPADDLLDVPWFAGLSRDALRTAARHADWIDVVAGTRLQRAGFHVQWVWVVATGALDAGGCPVEPGQAWGETEVVLGVPAASDVVAAVPSRVVSLPAAAFHGLFDQPSFATAVARRLARAAAAA